MIEFIHDSSMQIQNDQWFDVFFSIFLSTRWPSVLVSAEFVAQTWVPKKATCRWSQGNLDFGQDNPGQNLWFSWGAPQSNGKIHELLCFVATLVTNNHWLNRKKIILLFLYNRKEIINQLLKCIPTSKIIIRYVKGGQLNQAECLYFDFHGALRQLLPSLLPRLFAGLQRDEVTLRGKMLCQDKNSGDKMLCQPWGRCACLLLVV